MQHVIFLLLAASLACLNGCRREGNAQNARVTIQCTAPGLAPEEVASEVSHPLELQLQSLPQVESVRSASREGQAMIWVEFARGADPMEARQAVAERLAATEQLLPRDVVVALPPGSSPVEASFLIALSAPAPGAADEPMALASSSAPGPSQRCDPGY
jgi:Cu/Ag efflux pump CusA